MDPLTPENIALTGVPRGGTTLACQLLQRCDDAVALFEPMDVAAWPRGDYAAALARALGFYAEVREQIARDGTAPSKQVTGRLPDNSFGAARDAHGLRELIAAPGLIRLEPRPAPGFTLVIKHNAAFTALLPELATQLRTLAIVRHPLSVLASWHSVNLPVRNGRIPAGERLDPELAASLDAQHDRLARQLLVLDWFFSRFDRLLPAQDVLRYEDVVASQGELLRERSGLRGGSTAGLAERNASALYSPEHIPMLARTLADNHGSWQRWYPLNSIAPLAERMLAVHEGR